MKRTRKLILALVVVMSLLMAMAVAVIPASAAEGYQVIYVQPSSNWKEANAYFALWSYPSGGSGSWTKLSDYDGDGIYTAYISTSHTKMNIVRINPAYSEPDWGGKWAQSPDITIDNTKCYYNSGWGESFSTKTVSITSKTEVSVAGSFNGWSTTATQAIISGNIANVTIELSAGEHEFKVVTNGNKWHGNAGTMQDGTAGAAYGWLMDNDSNCKINVSEAGFFGFEFDTVTGYLTVHKHTGGTATCTAQAVCEVCDESYGELADHAEYDACPHVLVGDEYKTVGEAFKSETTADITLNKDFVVPEGGLITGGAIKLAAGVTLDLNGQNLKAAGVVNFGDAEIKDTVGGGLLIVNKDDLVGTSSNYLALWTDTDTDDGFTFKEIGDQYTGAYNEETDRNIVDFRPKFAADKSHFGLFSQEASKHGVTFSVRILVGNEQVFTATVQEDVVINAYKNAMTIRLTLKNADANNVYNIQLVMKSAEYTQYVDNIGYIVGGKYVLKLEENN